MDVVRRPYTTVCQFNAGGPPARIRWYIVPPGTPTLGIPSPISSLDWLDEPYTVGPIGERPGEPRPYDRRPPPVVAGLDHVCGTLADFEQGGQYLPDLPPVEYAPDGLPACCRPLPDALVLGGGAQLLADVSILLSGGYTVPSMIEGGPSCLTAATLSLGVEYTSPEHVYSGLPRGVAWFRVGPLDGAARTIHVHGIGPTVYPASGVYLRGSACGSFTGSGGWSGPDVDVSYGTAAGEYLWVSVVFPAATPPAAGPGFTIEVD